MGIGLFDLDPEPHKRRTIFAVWLMVAGVCASVRWHSSSGAVSFIAQVGLILAMVGLLRILRAVLRHRREERGRQHVQPPR